LNIRLTVFERQGNEGEVLAWIEGSFNAFPALCSRILLKTQGSFTEKLFAKVVAKRISAIAL
jgi:hypothetical protein